MLHLLPALALLVSTAALSHSYELGSLRIDHPYARTTVAQQANGAAYLTVENRGAGPDALVSASSPAAKEVQLHSMKMDGDVMRMRELSRIEVAPRATVEMKPGDGHHLMLIGLKQPLKAGDKVPVTLVFEKAGKLEVVVAVEEKPKSGGAAPHGHSHAHQGSHKH